MPFFERFLLYEKGSGDPFSARGVLDERLRLRTKGGNRGMKGEAGTTGQRDYGTKGLLCFDRFRLRIRRNIIAAAARAGRSRPRTPVLSLPVASFITPIQ